MNKQLIAQFPPNFRELYDYLSLDPLDMVDFLLESEPLLLLLDFLVMARCNVVIFFDFTQGTMLQDNWEGGAKCSGPFRAKLLRISIN